MPAFSDDLVAVTLAARQARGKGQEHFFRSVNVRINLDGFIIFFARLGEQLETVNRMRPAAVAFITEKLLPRFSGISGKTQSQQTQYQIFDCQRGDGILPLLSTVGNPCLLPAGAIYWSAFLGRKNMPGPMPSGYGVAPSAV